MKEKWKSHAIQSLTSSRLRTDQEIRSDPQLNPLNCLPCFISIKHHWVEKFLEFTHSINSLVRTLHNIKALNSYIDIFDDRCKPFPAKVNLSSENIALTVQHNVLCLILAFVFAVNFIWFSQESICSVSCISRALADPCCICSRTTSKCNGRHCFELLWELEAVGRWRCWRSENQRQCSTSSVWVIWR